MEGKMKVSFGIKTSKQGTLTKKVSVTKSDVEYISSFDGTYKPLGLEKSKEDLVIPSKANKIGKEFLEELNKEKQEQSSKPKSANNGKLSQSLEALAVKELMEEAEGSVKNESKEVLNLPIIQASDANEATLEDYENIPVEDFGKAMLRGMGWNPGMGIGKNQRVVTPVELQLRPKGMGLGADKMAVANPVSYCSLSHGDKELSLGTGCGTQIVAGSYKGLYGKIVSHNEDSGRCIVKLEIGGSSVSINENLLKPVSKEEYATNSRVLNADKFRRYKESSEASQLRKESSRSDEEVCSHDRGKRSPSDSRRRRRERSRSPVK